MRFDIPKRHYRAILADPGTEFVARSPKGVSSRSPQKKYTTMSLAEIAALPVGELACDDSFLFYWTTTPLLAIGAHIPIMRAWGFKPTAIAFTWVKARKYADLEMLSAARSFAFGGGFTTRKNTEPCVLGRRGNPVRLSKSVRELIIAPRREHSRKPDQQYERIEQFCAGPYLELFSRQSRDGWDSWGDQMGIFDGQKTMQKMPGVEAGRPQ